MEIASREFLVAFAAFVKLWWHVSKITVGFIIFPVFRILLISI
jgi:hypothetical protein